MTRRARTRSTGSVRIIGGLLRSRRIRFDGHASLRPTPDRVRETLFNWLANHIHGSRCLDLFAGSGALGFEAVSRGAASATLIENNVRAADRIRDNARILGATAARVVRGDAWEYLRHTTERFDIVFLDPPFDNDIVERALATLIHRGVVSEDALVYTEQRGKPPPKPPDGPWRVRREDHCGDVCYRLLERVPVTVPEAIGLH